MSIVKGSKKLLITLIIVGVVVFLGILILINQLRPKEDVVPTVPVVLAAEGGVNQDLDVSGTVKSLETRTFFSPVNAKINKMDVEVGDVVNKGAKIITFDLKDLERDNQKAELSVLTGQYDYEDIVGQAEEADDKVANAQANVNTLQGSVDEWEAYVEDLEAEILQANADAQADAVAQAENMTNSQTQELARINNDIAVAQEDVWTKKKEYLKADQALKANSSDEKLGQKAIDAQLAYDKAQEKLEGHKAELEALLGSSGSSAADAAADTLALQQELEDASTILAELKAELGSEEAVAESGGSTLTDAAREKLEISTNLSSLEAKSLEELIAEGKKGIDAEFQGVVADAKVVNGAMVTQGMELFTLQSMDDVCVKVNISKNDFDKVKKGQKADITLSDNEYTGTVTKVDRIALPDEKGNAFIKATIKIDNPDENIFIGVDAKVVLHVAEVKDVVTVSPEAINIGNDGSFCYVIEDGVIVKRPVETGVSSIETVEITSGLKKGDSIITDVGDHKEGDRVKGREATDDASQESE
jgi:RND family efflux transporter MFP subunit